jgi:hypothetical protein
MAKVAQIRSRYKRVLFRIIGGLGVVLGLVLVFCLLAPKLIDLEPFRQKAVAGFYERTGGDLDYERMDLSFLPRPCVIIQKAKVRIPDKGAGGVESLAVYPRVLSLLKGEIRVAEVRAEAPDFVVPLPAKPEKEAGSGVEMPSGAPEGILGAVLSPLSLEAPDLILAVERGRVVLVQQEKPTFAFEEVNARLVLPPDGFEITLNCTSNLWEEMALESTLGLEPLKASGRIDVKNFRPHKLFPYLFPQVEERVGDSDVSLALRVSMDGLKAWEADLAAPVFHFAFGQGESEAVFKGKGMRAAFHMDGDHTSISLSEFKLEQPNLALSGKILIDGSSQKVRAELEGREVHVPSVRETALAVAGHIHNVQEIFDVVQGGIVPRVACSAQGNSLPDLLNPENLSIEGRLVDGRVFVGEAGLDLEEVQGNAVISGGILEGKNLEARFGNSRGRQGRLKLGLEGDAAPFNLDIMVDADLAQLPPVLRTIMDDHAWVRELDGLEELKGEAVGQLTLGGSTAAVDAKIDVSALELSARYKTVSYPMGIKGGRFLYDDRSIAVEDLSGSVGQSAFTGLTGRIDWKRQPDFEIRSGKCRMICEEIFPWLSSLEALSDIRDDYRVPKGLVVVSEMAGKGLLSDPASWQFRAAGSLKDVVLRVSSLPDALNIVSGKFTALEEGTQQRATFQDVEIRFLDASVKASGILHDYLNDAISGGITFAGNFDTDAMAWISELARMRDVLDFRMPLSFSQARLEWKGEDSLFFKAEATVGNGPQISTEMQWSPRALVLDEVIIRDQGRETHMAFAFDNEEKSLSLNFRGHLSRETINRLFVTNPFTKGWIKGDFQARVLLKDPAGSSAKGTLSGDDLVFPLALDVPLLLDSVELSADGRRVRIHSALCTWGDQRLALDGDVGLSPSGFDLDLNLKTPHLDLNKIQKAFGENWGGRDQEKRAEWYAFPVQGRVQVSADACMIKSYNWRPLHAEVSLRKDKVSVTVTEARVCGISTSGVLDVAPAAYSLDFKLLSENQDVAQTAHCLLSERLNATGKYTLKGAIAGRGKPETLVSSLQGNLELLAENGRIHRHVPMQKLFAYLNVTDLFRGRIPDMSKEGFPYNVIDADIRLQNRKLIFDEWILDSPSMEIIGQGEVDLGQNRIDMTVLVAPLKAVDSVVKRIPGVRYITGGALISGAAKIEGDLKNPGVKALPASAVGEGLLGMMKRTLKLPIKVIEPVRSRGKEQDVPLQAGP